MSGENKFEKLLEDAEKLNDFFDLIYTTLEERIKELEVKLENLKQTKDSILNLYEYTTLAHLRHHRLKELLKKDILDEGSRRKLEEFLKVK